MSFARRMRPAVSLYCLGGALSVALVACSSSNSGASLTKQSDITQAQELASPNHVLLASDHNFCVAAASTDNGTRLTVAPCSSSQALTWDRPGNGQLKLSGKCLDVVDGNANDGAAVQLYDCYDNNTNQQWMTLNNIIQWSAHNFCIDLKDGNTGAGAALQIWTCYSNNVNQQWVLQNAMGDMASQTGNTNSASSSNANTTPTTATPAAATSSGSLGRAACKRGVAADSQTQPLTAAALASLSSHVTWWYNWYVRAGDATVLAADSKLNMDYVQMVTTSTNFDDLENNVPAGARFLLTFNEPNFNDRGILPEDAAKQWPKITAFAAKHNLQIVGPAMNYCWSNCNVSDPIAWLDRFFAACSGCQVDHIALHAYTCDVGQLKSQTLDPFRKYNKPIWLTEFDCADSGAIRNDVASQKTYMAASVAALEADAGVYRYAWFMANAQSGGVGDGTALIDNSGNLTDLGNYYLSLPQSCQP